MNKGRCVLKEPLVTVGKEKDSPCSPEKLFPRILENMVKLTWAEAGT